MGLKRVSGLGIWGLGVQVGNGRTSGTNGNWGFLTGFKVLG